LMRVKQWDIQCTRGPKYQGVTVIWNTPAMCRMSVASYKRLLRVALNLLGCGAS
jgi:hypothetical protein